MLVLFETAAGYAIFKLMDENKLEQIDNLYQDFETANNARKIVQLQHFQRFVDTTEALAATTSIVEGKLSKSLKKLLKKEVVDETEQLLVADPKLGNVIKEKLNISCVSNNAIGELFRCIRAHMDSLITDLSKKDLTAMSLGLAHSLSRYKLKFSPDKVDTMIVQAVNLLEDLDKELNNYMMRCREWYGWHFPELGRILTDNIQFIKTVKLIGTRDHTRDTDMSDILPEDLEERVKNSAEVSVGTEISEEDIKNIWKLCDQVLAISSYRTQLFDYLKSRMMAVAPNVTVLLGELVAARLVANAGSLVNLAKQPASTIQILGAEKALFRALKTKRDTPKYGIIYHNALIGQAGAPFKGKMARMLAAKAALATRLDAFGEDSTLLMGVEHKALLENKLKMLEEGGMRKLSGTAKVKAKFEKYHGKQEVQQYSAAADSTMKGTKRKVEPLDADEQKPSVSGAEQPFQKKKKVKQEPLAQDSEVKDEPSEEVPQAESAKKKKKKKKVAGEQYNVEAVD